MKTVVILLSGRGSNMQAIVNAALPGVRIACVISNVPQAAGLEFARAQGLPVDVVDHRLFPDRPTFDAALAKAIDAHTPDLVVLAGFMRILGEAFVRHYEGRLINIHPSLLPAFRGLDTHARALQAGVRVHGASVHFVTPTLDEGPLIVQAVVPVMDDDDEATLAARVLAVEHRIYPQAVRWFCEGRLCITGARVVLQPKAGEPHVDGNGGGFVCPPLPNPDHA